MAPILIPTPIPLPNLNITLSGPPSPWISDSDPSDLSPFVHGLPSPSPSTKGAGAFSTPFIAGIEMIQTLTLGILLVLALVTLFHCREERKQADAARAKAVEKKLAEINGVLGRIESYLRDVGGKVGVELDGKAGKSGLMFEEADKKGAEFGREDECRGKESGASSVVEDDEKKRTDSLRGWEGDVLRRLRGI